MQFSRYVADAAASAREVLSFGSRSEANDSLKTEQHGSALRSPRATNP